MASTDHDHYDGFRTFDCLSKSIGLPIDQVNFLITQFTALVLAGIFRKSWRQDSSSETSRHVFSLVVGLALGYFSFGKQMMHLVGLSTICYVLMRILNPRYMQRAVLAVALIYLSSIHFHRQMNDYGSYTLDITGPLMVITQKVTSLAFNVHDGLSRKQEEVTPSQRNYAVQEYPTVLEYFSYIFHFQTLMVGPIIFYRDYIDFIRAHGSSIRTPSGKTDYGQRTSNLIEEPSPFLAVTTKVTGSLICALIFITLLPFYPIKRIKDEEFLNSTSMLYKYWYLIVATMLIRFKYYHAWLFADAICNNSGLGYSSHNQDSSGRWDLVSNVDAFKFETALSLKDAIEAWNKGTNRWLRMIVYDRVKHNKTNLTYALSAVWHGFYPGYYLTFANGALITFASRTVRKHIRPYFLTSRVRKLLYDILTMVVTRFVLAYIIFSFILLEFKASIVLYLKMYLAPHLIGMSAILVLPMLTRAREGHGSSGSKTKHEKPMGEMRTTSNSNGHMHKSK